MRLSTNEHLQRVQLKVVALFVKKSNQAASSLQGNEETHSMVALGWL